MNSDPRPAPRPSFPLLALMILGGYWLLIFIATHIPLEHVPGHISHNDKFAHFAAYAGLSFLMTSALLATRPFHWRYVGYVLMAVALYGVLDELTQTLVGRKADVADWLADMVGATVGIWAGLFAARLLRLFLPSVVQKPQ